MYIVLCMCNTLVIIMERTTIMLPDDLRTRAASRARELGISMGELIRIAIETALIEPEQTRQHDTFFSDRTVFRDNGPDNLAENHDQYLYGASQ